MSLESPPNKAIIITDFHNPDTVDQIRPNGGTVILQPIAMRIPNSHGVYSPSQLRPQKAVSYEEFLARYANHPRGMRVCFDEIPTPTTIIERSELVTAYGFGLDCWYVVTP
ncbi:MAG: hypothetical protein JSU72_17585 [Deltaproteobacteria bacterium]|nr:MAG: hypothetical protein JSU72_17585 [Deltaproteobacteria bacterium]